jgi:hypothetical protein|tara:strand:- start:200 stop:388 length:189 start_codon:yes stop_codon:yes gene_type:complete
MERTNSKFPTDRELLNKVDNDISLLRGEVMRLTELVKILVGLKKNEHAKYLKKKQEKAWGLF